MQQFEGSLKEQQEDYSENYEDDPYGGEFEEEDMDLNDYDREDASPESQVQPYQDKKTSEKKSQSSSDEFNKGSTLGKRAATADQESSAKDSPTQQPT